MRPVEIISGMGERRDKEKKVEGENQTKAYCKHFCKCVYPWYSHNMLINKEKS
jgi:hypothetical protein